MEDEHETPHISKALVAYLDSVLPTRDHKPHESLSDIMFYSGQRSVVNLLKDLLINKD